MEGIHNLSCLCINKHYRELDDLVQVGPRVLFARALEVQHTNDSRGGALFWWWGWWRSWSLSLFASLASSGLDSRQSGAFRGECNCRRGEEGEAHFSLRFHLYLSLAVSLHCAARAFQLHECGDFVACPIVATVCTVRCLRLQAVAVLSLDNL